MLCKTCAANDSNLTEKQFHEKYDIDPDEIGYAGKGDNGTAYHVSNDRILKITRSKPEWDLAKELLGRSHEFSNFVEYYAAEIVDGDYYILMEEISADDSEIEDLFGQAQEYLIDGPAYPDHFDPDDFEDVNPYVIDFIDELCNVVYDYRKLGVFNPDIRAENLGRDSAGTLKAFDIFNRSN